MKKVLAMLFYATICSAATSQPTTKPWQISADHTDGIYERNQPIHFAIRWAGDTPAPPAHYRLLRGQMTSIAEGEIAWRDNSATVDAKLDQPGTVLLKVNADSVEQTGLGGAIVSPQEIKLAASKPADFDSFWKAKFQELSTVNPDPQIIPRDSGKPGVDYWQITMNNVRGIHIRGQLARPRGNTKCPALLIVQWAGVYGLDPHWVTDRAAEGWLVLDISPHDIPIDQPPQFYKDQFAGPLKDYWAIGNGDRDTCYFLHMYLSCYRGADYLAGRPDWNGKTLVVMGGSQGGQQSLLTAAIYPKITAALADVPAGCDDLGPVVDRKGGWPQWYDLTAGKDAEKVRNASRYYDIANFAPQIHCPVCVGAGLIDQVCPVAGVMAAMNQVSAPKEIHLFPVGEHQNEGESHGLYDKAIWSRWLPALVHDEPAPVHPGID